MNVAETTVSLIRQDRYSEWKKFVPAMNKAVFPDERPDEGEAIKGIGSR
jgi:hypothetical protein